MNYGLGLWSGDVGLSVFLLLDFGSKIPIYLECRICIAAFFSQCLGLGAWAERALEG